jgi:hypothetical protein
MLAEPESYGAPAFALPRPYALEPRPGGGVSSFQ